MKYNFDEVIKRIGTDSEKWESGGHGNVYYDENSLSFSIADMDFALAPSIDKAIRDRLDLKVLGYTEVATEQFRNCVCGWFKRRFDWDIDGKLIYTVGGVMDGVRLMGKLAQQGEGVVVQQPVYPPFMSAISGLKLKTVVNQLVKDQNNFYTVNFEELESQLADPNNKIMLLCSPHNPVGRVWTEDELCRIADLCHKHDVILISDEIHCDLVRKGVKHTPVAKLRPDYDIITCVSPSKTFNIAGLEIANVIFSNMQLRIRTLGSAGGMQCANPLSIAALLGAYNGGEDWLDEVRDYIDGNLKFLKDWLDGNLPKVKYRIPDGTYLAWLDVSAYQPDSEKFAKDCGKGGIIIEQGDVFGLGGKGFIRFNAATPRSIIAEGLARMKKVVDSYK